MGRKSYPPVAFLDLSSKVGEARVFTIDDVLAENAKLKEALRECVEVLEKFTCPECKPKNPLCVVTGEPPCEIVSIPKKAREVLGDA